MLATICAVLEYHFVTLLLTYLLTYCDEQVIYAVREYAATAVDVLARRTRLAFLNVRAAEESLPRVIELMSRELGWSKQHEQVPSEPSVCHLIGN